MSDGLDPNGHWRCHLCGGLVPEWGMYTCGPCAFPDHRSGTADGGEGA